jgi:hypothetical protein
MDNHDHRNLFSRTGFLTFPQKGFYFSGHQNLFLIGIRYMKKGTPGCELIIR